MDERLYAYWQNYRPYLKTQTRDTGEYGFRYISGLLRMDTDRTMANVGRKTGVAPQNMQHFISNSPWSGENLVAAVQRSIAAHPEFRQGAILQIDESAVEKAGQVSAGAGRQHNGRLGKVELSQVGVFASLSTPKARTWVDGELFLPQVWFDKQAAAKRRQAGIPSERQFQSKPELAWQMIQRLRANGVSFEAVAMDTLYGRNRKLRARLAQAGIEYYADVPANTRVYLSPPRLVYRKNKKGNRFKRPLVVGRAWQPRALVAYPHLNWQRITLRPSERGMLRADFVRIPVWTLYKQTVRQEYLLIRIDTTRITYTLSNAGPQTSLATMAWRKSHRYFIENSNRVAKSDLGWDEFQATKYRAWQHHLALTILASWFVTETILDWNTRFQRDPQLLEHYEVDVLPLLSVANVRELLRAAMPLPQLSPSEAASLVIEHLINRVRSRKSRLRHGPAP